MSWLRGWPLHLGHSQNVYIFCISINVAMPSYYVLYGKQALCNNDNQIHDMLGQNKMRTPMMSPRNRMPLVTSERMQMRKPPPKALRIQVRCISMLMFKLFSFARHTRIYIRKACAVLRDVVHTSRRFMIS